MSDWNECNKSGNIFLSYNFLKLLENSGCVSKNTGWEPLYFCLLSKNKLLACAASYIKMHSQGEYVFDHAWANAYKSIGLNYYPKLLIASPFSPVSGMRILSSGKDYFSYKEILIKNIKKFCETKNFSGLHINFFDENELKMLQNLSFTIRTGEQFHFYNKGYKSFEQFLETLSYRKRKNIIKERKSLNKNDIEIVVLKGNNITKKVCGYMYEFYISTIQKKWSYDYLNKDFFLGLPKLLKNNIIIILAKRNAKVIAGSLNFLSNNILYGRYWGSNESYTNLHFEVCYYKPIEIAIELGLSKVEAGAQGSHKIQRGYVPTKTFSAHFLFNPTLQNAIKEYVKEEKKLIDSEIDYIEKTLSPYKKS